AARRDRERDPRQPAPAPDLGRQEVARPAAQAPSAVEPSRSLHGLRHSEAARDGTAQTSPAAHWASGPADQPDPRPQRRLERRLQGPVPDGRWAVLLSPDGGRWAQSLSLGLPSPGVDGGRRGETDLYAAVPGVRAADADSHR